MTLFVKVSAVSKRTRATSSFRPHKSRLARRQLTRPYVDNRT